MKKPFIALATLTLGLTFGALMTLPVAALDGTARDTSADDGVMPISETDDTTNEVTDTTEVVDETTVTTDEATTDLENLEEAGTSGEAEVVCTEEGDEDCAAEVETTEEEPAEDCELDEDGQVVTPADEVEPLFNWVKLGSDVQNEEFATIEDGSVVIKGVAVQSANLTAKEAESEAQKVLAEYASSLSD